MNSIMPIANPATVRVSQVDGEPTAMSASPAKSGTNVHIDRSVAAFGDFQLESVFGWAIIVAESETQ